MKKEELNAGAQKPLIIYHANCLDGFGAAYAAELHFRAHGGCELYAASHGEAAPDCAGRRVYILDFSYKREELKNLCAAAERITIVDHHISAQNDLAGLDAEQANLEINFNMEKSGAVLSWEYFHDTPPPSLLLHVQDRDLWRFELEHSADVNAAMMSRPYEIPVWEAAAAEAALPALIQEGHAINQYRGQLIARYKKRAVIGTIAGYQVPVVNCPQAIVSDLLHELAENQPFAAGYEDKGEKRAWSLRSRREGGADVSVIATSFGGGGHKNAAGFATALPGSLICLEPPA